MAKQKNIERLAGIIRGVIGDFGDGSGSWCRIENETHSIEFQFDIKGDNLIDIIIAEKVYQVVDEPVIARFNPKKQS